MTNAMLWKILGLALAALVLLGLVSSRNQWKAEAERFDSEAQAMFVATRAASGNPKLIRRDTVQQIQLLGSSLARCKGAIERQNQAVAELGARTAEQQRAAAEASLKAATRAGAALATSERLMASARGGGAPGGSQAACEPSAALKEAWR
ncbi:MAG TPA: hypothetical protein VM326_02330 [Sphingomicrobium sp.]|nr:hypothetical protein [Sphingomicrobium sp.]